MKVAALIATILACGLSVFSQQGVTAEDRALVEQLSHDYSFTIIPESADLLALNTHKRELYSAYVEKSPKVVKRFKRNHVGWEGQFAMT